MPAHDAPRHFEDLDQLVRLLQFEPKALFDLNGYQITIGGTGAVLWAEVDAIGGGPIALAVELRIIAQATVDA